MKAEKIMIGDWVLARFPRRNSKIHNLRKLETVILYPEYFEPIPIIPEILEKNGFVLESDGWMILFLKGGQKIEYRIETKTAIIIGYNTNVDGEIKYVHELQHAMRLCGIDKEIVL